MYCACAIALDAKENVRVLQAILLFPGGAREACHGPTEKPLA